MKINFTNAFTLPNRPALSAREEAFIHRAAKNLIDKQLALPACLAAESARPLRFLGFSAALFFKPFAELAAGPANAKLFYRALENPRALDLLAKLLKTPPATSVENQPPSGRKSARGTDPMAGAEK